MSVLGKEISMDLIYGQAGVDQCCSGEGFIAHDYILLNPSLS